MLKHVVLSHLQVLLRPLTGELLEAVRAVPAPVLNRVPHTTGRPVPGEEQGGSRWRGWTKPKAG